MIAQDILIGVDGGGTKTKVRVEDDKGQLIGQSVAGPANIRLTVEGAWQSIYTALNAALLDAQISLSDNRYNFHICLGLAGCEVKEAYQAFLSKKHPFNTIYLTSDSHTACVGAHRGCDGAIIIVGTGVVGFQIEGGKHSKVGGWGFPQDDEGSGAWLGLQAVRYTLHWLDHRAEKSPLVEEIFSYFNNNLDRMVSWTHTAKSSDFALLAPIVIKNSQRQEPLSLNLIKKAATAIDRISDGLLAVSRSQIRIPCSLFGGLASFIEPWLKESVRKSLVPHYGDAESGALLILKNLLRSSSPMVKKEKCFEAC